MKKLLLPILLFMMFVPFIVNAESKYLYDVLKDEAESGVLAKEYTGEHHDSFTEEPSKKIYHWYAKNDDNASNILNKWNVSFAGFCWQMFRTTDTGGVKLIYNGEYKNIYDKIPLQMNEYTILSNTANYFWNTENNGWETFITDGENKEFVFNLPTDDNYVLSFAVTSGRTSGGSVILYKDNVSIYGNGGGWGNTFEGEKNLENIESTNVFKIVYQGSSSESSPIRIKFKFTKNDKLLGKGCDESLSSNHYIGSSRFNEYGNSPAYVGFMIPRDEKIKKFNDHYPKVSNSIIFGNKAIYNSSTNSYSLEDTGSISNNRHYSCNSTTKTTCSTVRYYYGSTVSESSSSYIELNNGENVLEVLNNMLNSDEINNSNSTIKTTIENWFKNNMINYSSYLEDTIYCGNRKIIDYAGWEPNNGDLKSSLKFKDSGSSISFICDNGIDKFSKNNESAKLLYPVGLMTMSEANSLNNNILRKTGRYYWLLSPSAVNNGTDSYINYIDENGKIGPLFAQSTQMVRPVISLIPNIEYARGDGSNINPFLIDKTYKISIQVKNETKNIDINISDMTNVIKDDPIIFKMSPAKGYKINSIKIIDGANKEIEFEKTENMNEYKFIMPASDVTIIPSYERVKNSVNVEDNKNTKEFIIEVNDATAVVYEDTVRFKVEPEDGYEVEKIEITDEEQNNINYRKTNNKNEYEFIMPDTDVVITPTYRKIESINVPDTLKNPNTGTGISIIIIFMLIISSITYIIFKRKKNYIMK